MSTAEGEGARTLAGRTSHLRDPRPGWGADLHPTDCFQPLRPSTSSDTHTIRHRAPTLPGDRPGRRPACPSPIAETLIGSSERLGAHLHWSREHHCAHHGLERHATFRTACQFDRHLTPRPTHRDAHDGTVTSGRPRRGDARRCRPTPASRRVSSASSAQVAVSASNRTRPNSRMRFHQPR